STPDLVELAGIAFLAGLHDAGVIATGKHFPGHGNTGADSHRTVPFVRNDRAALEQVELRPFRAAVRAGVDAILPAHVVYPALDPAELPATVSAPIQTGLLRGELGFDGVIVTDDMGMRGILDLYPPEEAAVQAVLAGADVVLCARVELANACSPEQIGQLRDGLLRAAAEGRLPLARIDESLRRIQALKTRYAVGPVSGDDLPSVGGADHLRIVADVLEAAGRP